MRKKSLPSPSAGPPAAGEYISQKAAAAALSITPRRLRQMLVEGAPGPTETGYDVAALRAWRSNSVRDLDRPAAGSGTSTVGADLKAEKLKQERIKTERMQLDTAQRAGGLIPRTNIERFIAAALAGLGEWCEQLPDVLGGIGCERCRPIIEARLRRELDQRREELAEELRHPPEDP